MEDELKERNANRLNAAFPVFTSPDWSCLNAFWRPGSLNRCSVLLPEHYATVSMTFVDLSSATELKVEYRGVPDNEEEQTKEGWKRYYFEAIKQTFGFGARLLWRASTVPFWFFPLSFSFNVFSSVQHTTSCCNLILQRRGREKPDELWSISCINVLIEHRI